VLFRLTLPKSNDALLDLGCCLGQALRQLRADGVCGSRLFGIDINPALIDVGRELFRDSDSLGATFVVGDMIDPDDDRVSQLEGQVTMVQADSFFHLFTWNQQLYIGKRIVSFLKPGTQNAVIFGRQAGKLKHKLSPWRESSPYLHNRDSFQELWNEVGRMTGTRWAVQFEPDGEPLPAVIGVEKDTLPVRFTVHQIS
jgi:SAM-dependent methyltransferase